MADLSLSVGATDAGAETLLRSLGDVLEQLGRRLAAFDGERATAEADVDTSRAEGSLNDLAGSGEEAGQSAGEGVSTGFLAKAAAIGAAAGTIGGLIMTNLTAAMDKETLGAKLQVQLGATSEGAAYYGKIAGDLYSNNFGDSLESVNEAVVAVHNNIGESFTDSDDVMKNVTGTVLSLSDAFGVDVAQSTIAVGSLLKNGLAPDAATALDIITKGFQQGVDKSDDFLDTLNEYGPQFSKFGISGQEAVGLLRQGLQGGARDADIVADAFKEFSLRAVSGSTDAVAAFGAIGLNGAEMTKVFAKGGPEAGAALDTVIDRLNAMKDPVARNAAGVALFGTQFEDMGTAFSSLDPSSAVAALGDVAGAGQKMNDTLGDTASGRIETLKRTIQTGLVDFIGGGLLPMFDKVAQAGSTIFGDAWGPVSDFLGFLAGTGGVVIGVIAGIVGVMWAWTTVSGALAAATLPISGTVLLIAGGIALLVAGVIYAYTHFEGFRAVVDAVWAAVKTAFTVAWDVISNVFTWIVDAASNTGQFFSDLWTGIGTVTSTVWNGIVSFFTTIFTFIQSLVVGYFTAIYDFYSTIFNGIVTIITTVWNGVVSFFTSIFTAISDLVTTVWNAITDYFTRLFYAHYDLFMGIWNAISGFASAIWNTISGAAVAIWTAIVSFFTTIWNGWVTIFTSVWTTIQTVATTVWNAISSFFTAAFAVFSGAWQLMWSTISSVFNTVWTAIQNFATTVWNAISAFFVGAFNNFVANFTAIWNGIVTVWNTVWNAIKTAGTTIWNAVVAFFTPAFNAFASFFSSTWNGIVTVFTNVWNKVKDVAKSVWDGVTGVFKTGVNAVIDVINWLADKVNIVLKFLLIPTIPAIPRMESGGVIGGVAVPALAAGGKVGSGFVTNGPSAIVGEGNPMYPEYVIPTDPRYRGRAMKLYESLGGNLMADGGILGGIGDWVGNAASTVWGGITSAASSVAGAIGDVANWVGGGVSAMVSQIVGAIRGMLPGGVMGDIGIGVANKAIDGIKAMVTKAYEAQQAAATSMAGVAVPAGPIVDIVRQTAAQFGWGDGAEFAALSWIISHESGWNPNAQNPTSTAYGLFQFLNGTWASTGIAKTSNPSLQALAGMRYIQSRYKDPIGAQRFWQANGWYANGGIIDQPTFGVLGEAGPEVILPLSRPSRAQQLARSAGLLGNGGALDASGIESKLDTLIDTLERRGAAATINVTGVDDPTEAARATVLALRLS